LLTNTELAVTSVAVRVRLAVHKVNMQASSTVTSNALMHFEFGALASFLVSLGGVQPNASLFLVVDYSMSN